MKEWFVHLNFWGNSAKLIFLGNIINPQKEKKCLDKWKPVTGHDASVELDN